jgi:hypothetical protein
MDKENKDSKKRVYTMSVEDGEGAMSIKRRNDGFTPYEILGIMEHSKQDILNQIAGSIQPDVVERQVVLDIENPRNANEEKYAEAKARGWKDAVITGIDKFKNPFGPGMMQKMWSIGWDNGNQYNEGQRAFVAGKALTDNPWIVTPDAKDNAATNWADGWHVANNSAMEKEFMSKKATPLIGLVDADSIEFTFSNSEIKTLRQLRNMWNAINDKTAGEIGTICGDMGKRAYDRGLTKADNPFGVGDEPFKSDLDTFVWQSWNAGWGKRSLFDKDISERFDSMEKKVIGEVPVYEKDAPEQFQAGYEARFNDMRRCSNPHLVENTVYAKDFMKTIKAIGFVGEWDLGWKSADAVCRETESKRERPIESSLYEMGRRQYAEGMQLTECPLDGDERIAIWTRGWEDRHNEFLAAYTKQESGNRTQFQENAFHTGHGAYSEGKDLDDNPYTSDEAAKAWEEGWLLASKSELCRNARYQDKMNWHFEGGRIWKQHGGSLDQNPFGNTDDLGKGLLTPSAAWDQGFIYECSLLRAEDTLPKKGVRRTMGLSDLQPPECEGFTAYVQSLANKNENPYDRAKSTEEFELWADGWQLAEERAKDELLIMEPGEKEKIIEAGIEGYITDDENPFNVVLEPLKHSIWLQGWGIGEKNGQRYKDIAFNKGVEDGQNGIAFNPYQHPDQQREWENGYTSVVGLVEQ